MSSRTDSRTDASPDGRSEREIGRRGAEADAGELSVKTPTRKGVLRTVFGLGEHDVRTYDGVVEVTGATTSELAERLDRDRSNVNRSLNRLRESGLVTRGRRLLDEGGHVYQYYAVDESTEDLVARAVDRWRSAALDAIAPE
ncbi:helix-turn-helix domain-containing protein [Halorubrum sp. Boch-26]|uniref:helix-turn-helix domain-containing protein n=1 Tax=Halorubrum sp. Boch-26 TaxID=2994426 RepID=UPI002468EE20|nr:helix-turn-helix domain-containing protein [Halorubrum sp. Boch-26]